MVGGLPLIKRRAIIHAVVLEKFGGLDSQVYEDIPETEPKARHVLAGRRPIVRQSPAVLERHIVEALRMHHGRRAL